jgi:hypothetical protein
LNGSRVALGALCRPSRSPAVRVVGIIQLNRTRLIRLGLLGFHDQLTKI